MRSELVVFNPPSLGRNPCVEEICKAMEVEQFVADAAVKRLHLRVLGRLSRVAELQGNILLGAPLQHRSARKFAAAIEAHCRRKIALHTNGFQNTYDVAAAERERYFDRQAITGKILHDDHCSKRPAKVQPIVDETDRPTFVRAVNRAVRGRMRIFQN